MAKNSGVDGKLSGWYINFGITAIAMPTVVTELVVPLRGSKLRTASRREVLATPTHFSDFETNRKGAENAEVRKEIYFAIFS
ncbi:hypothetical protein [Nostoc sp.]|uniref:hypothetical protein n=1 Tax=Nostoc sp. TaxID=1180 RepID=UPI002FF8DB2D